MKASKAFDNMPSQWGLRGDPFLWEELKNECQSEVIEISVEDFEQYLKAMFLKLTGQNINSRKPIYVEKYCHGGMSSGYVDPNIWRDKLIPNLVESFRMINHVL